MKIVCETKGLQTALATVARALPSGNSLQPKLENIRFTAEPDTDTLRVTACDGQMLISVRLNAINADPLDVLLPGKLMTDFTSKLPKGSITLDCNKATARVSCGSIRATLPCVGPDGYPDTPADHCETRAVVNECALKELIARTRFAASNDPTRPTLCGTRLISSLETQTVRAVACDGYRMAIAETSGVLLGDGELAMTIPARALRCLSPMLSSDDSVEATISVVGNMVIVDTFAGRLCAPTVEGGFMQYDRIIPRDDAYQTTMTVGREALVGACVRAMLDRAAGKIVRMQIAQDTVQVSSRSSLSQCEVADEIDAGVSGADMTLVCNGDYLIDALRALDSEDVTMRFVGPRQPFTIVASDGKNADGFHLILPMRDVQ